MQVEQYDEVLSAEVSRRVMLLRLTTGLVQGVLLYLLYRAATINMWPATQPFLFMPLFMLVLLLPVVFISSLGHMTSRSSNTSMNSGMNRNGWVAEIGRAHV